VILRRLYLYLVSAAALILLTAGLALLGGTVLLFIFGDPTADSSRTQLAGFTAMTVVALPVWGVHFWFAQRFATRDPYERSSAIRHVYVYGACLLAAIAAMVALSVTLMQILQPVLDGVPLNRLSAAQTAWAALVFATAWIFHFNIATEDRKAVHEEGVSSTLRRWYMYVALLVGLLTMLSGTQSLLQAAWTTLVIPVRPDFTNLASPAAYALGGALLWGFHARTISVNHLSEDRHSTLRALEGFIAVAISIAIALLGASQILYYVLARALGVNNPGGAGNDPLQAAAGPCSMLLVYGVAWFLIRRRLARDAGTQEADRQAGVRRLYTNLASLLSLAAWAIGGGGVLWTVAEQLEAPIIGVSAPDWKNPISLWTMLLIVGAAVWLAHWRDAPWAADRQSLSRRLYVWAALLASVLAVIGGGVGMINVLFQQAFSAHPRLNDPANLDFGHFLAVIVVAVGVGLYHLRVLRADAAARPPKAAAAPIAVVAQTPAGQSAPAQGHEGLGPHARRYTLVVSDATEDDVHQALSNLPPQAGYHLTPTEQAVDGH
jgi:hypothetical protein